MRLIHTGDKHNKFWEAEIDENTHLVTCRWGRLGTKGQSKSFPHGTRYAAECFVDDKASEKRRKGYHEVDEDELSLKKLQAELVGAGCKIHELFFINLMPPKAFYNYDGNSYYQKIESQVALANPDVTPLIYCEIQLIGSEKIHNLLIDSEQVYTCSSNTSPTTALLLPGQFLVTNKKPITDDSDRILKKIRDKAPGIVSALVR